MCRFDVDYVPEEGMEHMRSIINLLTHSTFSGLFCSNGFTCTCTLKFTCIYPYVDIYYLA